MFLPLYDDSKDKRIPFATYFLIFLNVGIYFLISVPLSLAPADPNSAGFDVLVQRFEEASDREWLGWGMRKITAYDVLIENYGFHASHPEWFTFVSSLFLHVGLMHLFGNMLFLHIFGDNVERALGALPYLLFYCVSGIMGNIFYSWFQLDASQSALIGASGAVSGILGYYFIAFPNNKVNVLIWFFIFFRVVPIAARWVLGLYFIFDNLLPFLFASGGSNVAYSAHIGGFIWGAWVGHRYGGGQKILYGSDVQSFYQTGDSSVLSAGTRVFDAQLEHKDSLQQSIGLDHDAIWEQDVARGDYERALQAFLKHFGIREHVDASQAYSSSAEPVVFMRLADGLMQLQRHRGAHTVLRVLVECYAGDACLPHAWLRLGMIERHAFSRHVAAMQYFKKILAFPNVETGLYRTAEQELQDLLRAIL